MARNERGAISLITAVSLVFIFGSAALGVDVGATASEKRDLQKVADLAALDAVRAVGDLRPAATDAEVPSARALRFARESALRNGFDHTDGARAHDVVVELGIGDTGTRAFQALPVGADEALANAVRVTAAARRDYHFAPGGADLEASAVAMNDAIAEIVVGSRLGSLRSEDSELMNNVLDGLGIGPVRLDALGYEGLASADVTLGEVWTALDLGTTDRIMRTEVRVADLVEVMIEVLNNRGDTASIEAATALADLQRTANIPVERTFTFEDLIEGSASVSAGGRVAAARIRVLDMLIAAAEVANGDRLVNVDVPVAQVPGVASGTVSLGLIEKPRFAIGPALQDGNGGWVTTARTAQARVAVRLLLERQVLVGTTTVPVDLPVYIDAATATASLTGLDCTAAAVGNEAVPASVHAVTSPLDARAGTVVEQSLTNPNVPPAVSEAVFAVAPPSIRVVGSARATAPGAEQDLVFTGPFDARTATVGSANLRLGPMLANGLTIRVEGVALPAQAELIAAQVRAALVEVLAVIDAELFEPLARALGIRMAGADVSNPWLDCAGRRLIQ